MIKILNFKLFLILFGILSPGYIHAQEILTGLDHNPVIQANPDPQRNLKSSRTITYSSVNLPFYDDFGKGIYPDTSRWIDNKCFINSSFPLFPPNHGVATLDAVDGYGFLYQNASPYQFEADALTSRPIRLDSIYDPVPRAITLKDSIYLSFSFQPQGTGNPPEASDSLVLQFGFYTPDSVFRYVDSIQVPVSLYIGQNDTIYPGDILFSPCDENWGTEVSRKLSYTDTVMLPCDSVYYRYTEWYSVWRSAGMPLDTFRNKQPDSAYFKQVMIPVTDSALYFRKDFQFRFINYASIASDNQSSWQSNCDYWNIDMVYLNLGRSKNDTVFKKIGFVNPAPSMLKRYQAMPYQQYAEDPTGEIKPGLEILMSNQDIINQTGTYKYIVTDNTGALIHTKDQGAWSLEPFYSYGYIDYTEFRYPKVDFFFKLYGNQDSASFRIDHVLAGDTILNPGDTITFIQKFDNYYAYDDGTPEFGYGLSPAGSQLAYRFNLNIRDTLRAVQIYFNHTASNANIKDFFLTVWNDVNGQPGEILYSMPRQLPAFSENLYGFQTYHLDTALPVRGTFYVGTIQTTGDNLNIGFDASVNSAENIYYNVTGKWAKSIYSGSLMIRPVLGKPLQKYPDNPPFKVVRAVNIFPNPNATGLLHLEPDFTEVDPDQINQSEISLFNLFGQKISTHRFSNSVVVSDFPKGIYFLRITGKDGKVIQTEKIIFSY